MARAQTACGCAAARGRAPRRRGRDRRHGPRQCAHAGRRRASAGRRRADRNHPARRGLGPALGPLFRIAGPPRGQAPPLRLGCGVAALRFQCGARRPLRRRAARAQAGARLGAPRPRPESNGALCGPRDAATPRVWVSHWTPPSGAQTPRLAVHAGGHGYTSRRRDCVTAVTAWPPCRRDRRNRVTACPAAKAGYTASAG